MQVCGPGGTTAVCAFAFLFSGDDARLPLPPPALQGVCGGGGGDGGGCVDLCWFQVCVWVLERSSFTSWRKRGHRVSGMGDVYQLAVPIRYVFLLLEPGASPGLAKPNRPPDCLHKLSKPLQIIKESTLLLTHAHTRAPPRPRADVHPPVRGDDAPEVRAVRRLRVSPCPPSPSSSDLTPLRRRGRRPPPPPWQQGSDGIGVRPAL